jgi:hypothetical protein
VPVPRRLLVVIVVGLLVLLAHAVAFQVRFLGNCLDDAYISFRYAESLAAGQGLVFNPGERVEGYSNFLWVVLLTPFAWIVDDLTRPAQVLGVLLSLGSVVLAVVALRTVFGVRGLLAAATVVGLLAGSGYLAAWAVGGLEGPLYGLLLLAAWALHAREAEGAPSWFPASGPLLVAAAMTRPEGSLVAIGFVTFDLLPLSRGPRRTRLARLAVVLVGLLAYHGWRFAYYGPHLLPNSVRAKVGTTTEQVLRGTTQVLEHFFLPYLPLLVIPLLLLPAQRRRPGYGLGLLLLWGYLLFIALVGGDWSWGRFFAPLLPVAAVICVGSIAAEGRLAPLWDRTARRTAALAVVLAYVGLAFVITSPMREMRHRATWAALDAERIAIGRWLRAEAPPETIIAVYAAGQIPYYSRLYTHDMLGLNDAHIASLSVAGMGTGGAGHEKYDAAYTLETVRPHVIIGGRYLRGIREHPTFDRDYVDVPRWRANNVRVRRDVAR